MPAFAPVHHHPAAWLPLATLPVAALLLRDALAPWAFMWVLAFALYAGCKWLTYYETAATGPRTDRRLAYLLGWPGMDGREFFRVDADVVAPPAPAWWFAGGKTALGLLLIYAGAPLAAAGNPFVAAWIGMVGVIFVLHFGTFHLLALLWRTRGIAARPLMNAPVLATSLTEFWGRRWNAAFHELVHRYLFRPLHRRVGAAGAVLAVFAVSGVIHDLVISVPARAGYGKPTAYFLLHGLGVLLERSAFGRRVGLGRGWRGRTFALAVAVLPVGWLFHPEFIHRIILPFLRAIGAF